MSTTNFQAKSVACSSKLTFFPSNKIASKSWWISLMISSNDLFSPINLKWSHWSWLTNLKSVIVIANFNNSKLIGKFYFLWYGIIDTVPKDKHWAVVKRKSSQHSTPTLHVRVEILYRATHKKKKFYSWIFNYILHCDVTVIVHTTGSLRHSRITQSNIIRCESMMMINILY